MNNLLVLIVDDTNHYSAVLEAWEKVGMANVTFHTISILERAEQPGLRDDMPLIPSLYHFLAGSKKPGYLLLATTKDETLVHKLVSCAQQVANNLEHPGNGNLFVIPITQSVSWTRQKLNGLVDHGKITGFLAVLSASSIFNELGMVASLLSKSY